MRGGGSVNSTKTLQAPMVKETYQKKLSGGSVCVWWWCVCVCAGGGKSRNNVDSVYQEKSEVDQSIIQDDTPDVSTEVGSRKQRQVGRRFGSLPSFLLLQHTIRTSLDLLSPSLKHRRQVNRES